MVREDWDTISSHRLQPAGTFLRMCSSIYNDPRLVPSWKEPLCFLSTSNSLSSPTDPQANFNLDIELMNFLFQPPIPQHVFWLFICTVSAAFSLHKVKVAKHNRKHIRGLKWWDVLGWETDPVNRSNCPTSLEYGDREGNRLQLKQTLEFHK